MSSSGLAGNDLTRRSESGVKLNSWSWLSASLAIVAASCGPPATPSDAIDHNWHHLFTDGTVDAQGILAGPDGAITIVGNTEGDSLGRSQAWIVEFDRQGEQGFRYTPGRTDGDKLEEIAYDGHGGWIVAGWTEANGADGWIARLDSNGEALWHRVLGGDLFDYFTAMAGPRDGTFIVAGATRSSSRGERDAWLVKMDLDGILIWEVTAGGAGSERAQGIALSGDGGAVVSGHTDSRGAGGMDAWVFAVDSNGEVLWDRVYGDEREELAFDIATTADDGFVIAGQITPVDSAQDDAWVFKIDGQGEEVWSHIFEDDSDLRLHTVESTPEGGFLVAGDRQGDTWVLGLDSQGTVLWDRVFPNEGRDYPVGVVHTSDGAVGVVGFTVYDDDRPWAAWARRLSMPSLPPHP